MGNNRERQEQNLLLLLTPNDTRRIQRKPRQPDHSERLSERSVHRADSTDFPTGSSADIYDYSKRLQMKPKKQQQPIQSDQYSYSETLKHLIQNVDDVTGGQKTGRRSIKDILQSSN